MMFSYLNELKERAGNPSNAEIAEKSGMQESTVSRMLSGNVDNPRFQTVVDLVIALGGSLDDLVGLVKAQPDSVQIDDPIGAVEKVLKAEETTMRPLDDAERQRYQERIKVQQEERAALEEKLEAQSKTIDQQRETISQQYATIREQNARLEAKQESIQHRDRIIAEKDREIQGQRASMRRQATRYIIIIGLLILGIFYLYWDGSNPNKGIFQYGQIVPIEGMNFNDAFQWLMERIENMRINL